MKTTHLLLLGALGYLGWRALQPKTEVIVEESADVTPIPLPQADIERTADKAWEGVSPW